MLINTVEMRWRVIAHNAIMVWLRGGGKECKHLLSIYFEPDIVRNILHTSSHVRFMKQGTIIILTLHMRLREVDLSEF